MAGYQTISERIRRAPCSLSPTGATERRPRARRGPEGGGAPVVVAAWHHPPGVQGGGCRADSYPPAVAGPAVRPTLPEAQTGCFPPVSLGTSPPLAPPGQQ